MKTENFNLIKLEADEGKVFDWVDLTEHTHEEENPETEEKITVQDHLYAKTIFLGLNDSANNYIEVDESAVKEG